MQPPLIGVTTYGLNAEGDFHLPQVYVNSIRRAGGIPLLVPPGETELPSLLAQLDGLLLAGGGDLDPVHYRTERHPTVYMVDAARDAMEIAMARLAASSTLPTLCICRGLQVLNVALGGSLIQHLPDVVGDTILHRQPPRNPASHPVNIVPGSRLHTILQNSACHIVSWHHQALQQLAAPLVVTAQADDGVIEAIEHPEHPWLLGVQWHPEMSAAEDPVQQQLFDAFIAEAARYRVTRALIQ
jgi:putative glutamine amidotransferase